MWTKYFTSSGYVEKYRKNYGEPDVIQVRQTFNDSLQARLWEEKVIRRLDAVKSNRWLNRQNAGKKFFCDCHTDKSKEKMSKANRKRIEAGTHNFLGPENNRKRIDNRYSSSLRSRIK